jgi:NADH-quinone oxidoreductase subunit J
MKLSDGLLILFGLATVLPAFLVAFSRNLIYAAFALLFTLAGMAGLYGFLGADFLAVLQILVYVGGILVLILFGVMFTQRIHGGTIDPGRFQIPVGVLLGVLVFTTLFVPFGLGYAWRTAEMSAAAPTIGGIGELLLSRHLLPFEVASVLLLLVLVGAVVLARKELE